MDPQHPVLVVDDDEINLIFAAEELNLHGFSVELARGGREALERMKLGALRLVLMDCQMPGLDGFATTREFRRWEATFDARLPIVALTSHSDDREREKARAAGMDDFLEKPLGARDIHRVMREFHGARRGGERPPPPPDLTPGVRRSPRLIELFLEHVPSQIKAIELAAAAGDSSLVQKEAHKLKGSCLAISAEPMAQTAELIRSRSSMGKSQNLSAELAELKARFSSVESLVRWELRVPPAISRYSVPPGFIR